MKNTQIIAVGNQKGGVGKTTNTVHIAAALAEMGRRCLIIDLDMNHGATRHFGIEADAFLGTFEILVGAESPADVIITEADEEVHLPTGVHLIPSRRKLEDIDQALSAKSKFLTARDILAVPLSTVTGKYDYIFLDTAPNATTPTKAAYTVADWFLLTALPEPFAVDGLRDALTDIQDAQARANPKLKLLGVVLSGVDKRTTLANSLTKYVDEAFSPDGNRSAKFRTLIGRSTVIPATQKLGRTLFQSHPTHAVTDQYRALAREIEERIQELSGNTEPAPVPEAVNG